MYLTPLEGMIDVLRQLDIQSVVNRAASRMVLIQAADVRIDSAKGARMSELVNHQATTYVVAHAPMPAYRANRGPCCE